MTTNLERARPGQLPQPIPIEPTSGLYLVPYDDHRTARLVRLRLDIHAVETRFVKLFRSVWNAIPEADRRSIVTFWRSDQSRQAHGNHGSPCIRLMDHVPGFSGVNCEAGRSITFFAFRIIMLTDDSVRYAIALGLALAYFHATGNRERIIADGLCETHTDDEGTVAIRQAKFTPVGVEANNIAQAWGFPSLAVRIRGGFNRKSRSMNEQAGERL